MSIEHSPARSKVRKASADDVDELPTKPTNGIDPLDKPVWGVRPIAEIINRSERATRHLIQRELIDVTKVGSIYTSTIRRLLSSLAKKQGAAVEAS